MNYSEENCLGFVKDVVAGNTYHGMLVEAMKGCLPEVFKFPVNIEPCYEPFDGRRIYRKGTEKICYAERSVKNPAPIVLKLQCILDERMDWQLWEQTLMSLSSIGKVCFEITGNSEKITLSFVLFNEKMIDVFKGIIRNVCNESELVICSDNDAMRMISKDNYNDLRFFDVYPPLPYYRAMTDYSAFSASSLTRLFSVIAGIKDGFGFYQLIIKPVKHNWQQNVQNLLVAENVLGDRNPFGKSSSKQIKDITKPLFAVSLRVGCVTKDEVVIEGLKSFICLFTWGGRSLNVREKRDFEKVLKKEQIIEMFQKRINYTTGMFLTASEAVTLFHISDKSITQFKDIHLELVHGIGVSALLQTEGLLLGMCGTTEVRLPDTMGNFNQYFIGSSRYGKSTAIDNQILYRVKRGEGVGLIDPHGDAIMDLLERLPEDCIPKVVYFNPCDKDWILQYNPFYTENEEDIGRLTLDYLNSFESMFGSSENYRMMHILSNSIYGLFLLKQNLAFLPQLFSKTPRGEYLRKEIVRKSRNEEVKRFWAEEFYTYNREAFNPVLNKISKIMLNSSNKIFSTTENRIDFKKILDEGLIFLALLPIGILSPAITEQIMGMLISQFQKAGLNRANIEPSKRKPYHLNVDEFHRASGAYGIMESIINECRKYSLFLTLSHQSSGQLTDSMFKSLWSVPNIFVFNVNIEDARKLARIFNGLVSVDDIINLGVGEVVARIGQDVVKFKTFPPLKERNPETAKKIIEMSRQKYYVPKDSVKKTVAVKREFDVF